MKKSAFVEFADARTPRTKKTVSDGLTVCNGRYSAGCPINRVMESRPAIAIDGRIFRGDEYDTDAREFVSACDCQSGTISRSTLVSLRLLASRKNCSLPMKRRSVSMPAPRTNDSRVIPELAPIRNKRSIQNGKVRRPLSKRASETLALNSIQHRLTCVSYGEKRGNDC